MAAPITLAMLGGSLLHADPLLVVTVICVRAMAAAAVVVAMFVAKSLVAILAVAAYLYDITFSGAPARGAGRGNNGRE